MNIRRQGSLGAILEAAYHRNVLLCEDMSCSYFCCTIFGHSYNSKFVTSFPCLQSMVYYHWFIWIDKTKQNTTQHTTLVIKSSLFSIISIIIGGSEKVFRKKACVSKYKFSAIFCGVCPRFLVGLFSQPPVLIRFFF